MSCDLDGIVHLVKKIQSLKDLRKEVYLNSQSDRPGGITSTTMFSDGVIKAHDKAFVVLKIIKESIERSESELDKKIASCDLAQFLKHYKVE